jgi:hypothetical protein
MSTEATTNHARTECEGRVHIEYIGVWNDTGSRAFDHGKYYTKDVPGEFNTFLQGLRERQETVGYFAIQAGHWVCWSYGEESQERWQKYGKKEENEITANQNASFVLAEELNFTLTVAGGGWENATYEVRIVSEESESPESESLPLPCIASALSNARDALQEKMTTHLAQVDERASEAEQQYQKQYDIQRNEWEKQLKEGMQEFEKHYEEQMKELRENLRAKREMHESRMDEMEHTYIADQQSTFDEAKQRMLNKINEFDLDVVGAQV